MTDQQDNDSLISEELQKILIKIILEADKLKVMSNLEYMMDFGVVAVVVNKSLN